MYEVNQNIKRELLSNDNSELNQQLELILENPMAYKDAISELVFKINGKLEGRDLIEQSVPHIERLEVLFKLIQQIELICKKLES